MEATGRGLPLNWDDKVLRDFKLGSSSCAHRDVVFPLGIHDRLGVNGAALNRAVPEATIWCRE